MKRIMAVLLLLSISFFTVYAQVNPFLNKVEKVEQAPKWENPITAFLRPILDTVKEQLDSWARDIKTDGYSTSFLFLVFGALGYGILHSIGPGHGKVVLSSYVLSKNYSRPKIIALSGIIATVHALTAVTIVYVVYYVLGWALSLTTDSAYQYMVYVSFGILMCLGIYQIVSGIRHKHGSCGHNDCEHDHEHEHANEDNDDIKKDFNAWGVIAAIGLVPCTGTMSLATVGISFNIIPQSLIAVAALAFGMGLTLAAFGLFAKSARSGIQKTVGRKFDFDRISHVVAGSFILFIAGSMFFGLIL